MEEEAPVIYGLEFQARALASQVADTETVRFFVGTQSLKFDNQIHLLEYDEENNSVSKTVFLHTVGEVWHISSSPTCAELMTTCYNEITSDGKCEMSGSLWKIPMDSSHADELSSDDSSSAFASLELVSNFNIKDYGSEMKSIIWEPAEGRRLASLVDNHLLLWDLDVSGLNAKILGTATAEMKGKPKFTAARWNPHQNCNLIATAIDTSVQSWDLRTMQQAWMIEGSHGQLVRDMDFNPNKQYYLATCGDDCQTKFWDVRNPLSPVVVLSDHSHWVWSVRYNFFHDQLILTSSSDSRVILSRIASISSEPFGQLVEDEESSINGEESEPKDRTALQDGVVSTYEEHEDSVYAAEWSNADPWLFASLSYDGRLVINKVPRAEKYRILL